MFTSRAEHRLLLREDNADLRLTPLGRELGLVDDERWQVFDAKQRLSEEETARLQGLRIHPGEVPAEWSQRVLSGPLTRDLTAFELLRRPEVSYDALLDVVGSPDWLRVPPDDRVPPQVRLQVEARAKYAGYIERQREEIDRQRRNEETKLPDDIDYDQVAGLSHEVRGRLAEYRPTTIGQAGRLPGVTPAAVTLLLVHLKKRSLAAERSRVA
jgi:tRNA uridine 5-carboxymethylaminomethyl modification enzyme